MPLTNLNSLKDLEKAHQILIEDVGRLRTKNIAHVAPSGNMIKGLMNDLFKYLKEDGDMTLIKSCVFHYEFEFIHPFSDGNGRMGRLWQTLMRQCPVFEFLPVESLIKETQRQYYTVLSQSDKMGVSTPFIEFML